MQFLNYMAAKKILISMIGLVFLFQAAGCISSPIRNLIHSPKGQVELIRGMSKARVIGLLGKAKSSEYRNGREVLSYLLSDDRVPEEISGLGQTADKSGRSQYRVELVEGRLVAFYRLDNPPGKN